MADITRIRSARAGSKKNFNARIFADSCYWIGLFDPKDELHARAVEARDECRELQLVTTEEALTESLTRMRASDKDKRTKPVRFLFDIIKDENVRILPQSHESFDEGVRLFDARDDKDYSLQDCISMNAMVRHDILYVLTNDHHFTQEGFVILL